MQEDLETTSRKKAEGIHIPSSVLVRAEMKSQEPKEDSRSAQP